MLGKLRLNATSGASCWPLETLQRLRPLLYIIPETVWAGGRLPLSDVCRHISCRRYQTWHLSSQHSSKFRLLETPEFDEFVLKQNIQTRHNKDRFMSSLSFSLVLFLEKARRRDRYLTFLCRLFFNSEGSFHGAYRRLLIGEVGKKSPLHNQGFLSPHSSVQHPAVFYSNLSWSQIFDLRFWTLVFRLVTFCILLCLEKGRTVSEITCFFRLVAFSWSLWQQAVLLKPPLSTESTKKCNFLPLLFSLLTHSHRQTNTENISGSDWMTEPLRETSAGRTGTHWWD